MSIVHVPFYPSDWLAGTRGLSAEETGVYITLVARIYEMAGPIKRDDNRLARLCGCSSEAKFVKALEYLISEGKIVERGGCITNERAEKEIKNVTGKSEKAKAAAQSRWDKKDNKNNGSDNANASVEHMPGGCQPKPKPDIEKELSDDSSKKTGEGAEQLQPDDPEKPPPQKTKKRATRLAPDWVPSGEQINFALKEGFDHEAANREADKFRDYWIGVGGQKGTKLDWGATWRNWIRNSNGRGGSAANQRPRNAGPSSGHQALFDGFAASANKHAERQGRFGECPEDTEPPRNLKLVSSTHRDLA